MIALDVLRVTSFTLASALLAQHRAHVPGDLPEDHEDNTYGLPGGAPIRRTLRRFFREQLKRTVGFVSKLGAQIPARFPSLADYDDPMASAMTPILGVYWDRAGKALNGRLGLDPDDWRVTDPNLHKAIANQSFKFCQATNATTDRLLSHALADLRHQFHQGLATEGETVEQLAKRVRSIFQSATKERALMIAQTEASRAVHVASEMSAIASGVVSAKRLLLSANSCPVCVRVAEEAKSVPLGGSFGTVGNSSEYSDIRMPPIHPHCLLPDTPIVAPLAVGGTRSQYDGPIVTLSFSDGTRASVTPNHMLLTPSGFARAADLVKGDDVIQCPPGERASPGHPDNQREPTPISEIFDSLTVTLGVLPFRVPVAPEYLHGDAAFCQGEIDVVTTGGLLRDRVEPGIPEPIAKSDLGRADVPGLGLSPDGRIAELLFAFRAATDHGMGGLRELKASLWGQLRHPDEGGIRSPSWGISGLLQSPHERRAGDAQRLRECQDRFPGEVATCHVVNVEIGHYRGPVYDIETKTSLYLIGNGIASSNCRCSVAFVLIDPEAEPVPAYVPRPKKEVA